MKPLLIFLVVVFLIIVMSGVVSAYNFTDGSFDDTILLGVETSVSLMFREFSISNCQAGFHFSSTTGMNDSCGGLHNGTASGTLGTISSEGLNLSAQGDEMDIAVTDAINMTQRNHTVTLWFKPDIISGVLYEQGTQVSQLTLVSSYLSSKINNTSPCYLSTGAGTVNETGKWYHAALVYINNESGGNDDVKIYLNGVEKDSANCPGADYTDDNGVITLGHYAWHSSGEYNGTIDEFLIFNRSLNSSDITDIYNQRKTIGYYNSSVYDSDDVSYSLYRDKFRWYEQSETTISNISTKICHSSDNLNWTCTSNWDESSPTDILDTNRYWKFESKFGSNGNGTALLTDANFPPKNIYYVDKNNLSGTCNDTYTLAEAANNISQPFCSFSPIVSVLSEAGEIIYVRNGTYYDDITYTNTIAGTFDYIYWMAYPGETVILDGRTDTIVGWTVNTTNIYNADCNKTGYNACVMMAKNNTPLPYVAAYIFLDTDGEHWFSTSENKTYLYSDTNPSTNGYTYYQSPGLSTLIDALSNDNYNWYEGFTVKFGNNDAIAASSASNIIFKNITSYYTYDDGFSNHAGTYNVEVYDYYCDNTNAGNCLEVVGDSTSRIYNMTAINPTSLTCLANSWCNITGLNITGQRTSTSASMQYYHNASGFISDAVIYNSSGTGIKIYPRGNGNEPQVDLYNVNIDKSGVYGLWINTTYNVTFQDGTIEDSTSDDVIIRVGNHLFTNVSYNSSKETVQEGNLTRKWYLDTSSNLDAVSISITNSSGGSVYSGSTNSSLLIPQQTLTSYINDGGTTTYYSTYTISASKSGYVSQSQTINLTSNQNLLFNLVAETTTITSPSGSGYPNYQPTESNLEKGYSKILKKNWKIEFGLGDKIHVLNVDDVKNDSVVISVESDKQTFELRINETKKLNLNADGFYDLEIFLRGIDYRGAGLTIKSIHEEISAEELKDKIKESLEDNLLWLWIVLGFVVVVAVILKIKYSKVKNKRKKKGKGK